MKSRPVTAGSGSAVMLTILCATACGDATDRSPLANDFASQEQLIQAVLDALADEDGQRMATYLVTMDEYEQYLWPKMPDKEYTPFEFVWGISYPRTRKGHRQALERYGGMELDLVSVSYTKAPETYESFTLHKGAQVMVRRRDTGDVGELPSFDVLVEYQGAWKLLNYDEL